MCNGLHFSQEPSPATADARFQSEFPFLPSSWSHGTPQRSNAEVARASARSCGTLTDAECHRNIKEMKKMPHYLYVCLNDEDKIAPFSIDADNGRLTPQAAVPVQGGPAFLVLSPDRSVLYVGHRLRPAISSFRVDQNTGGLAPHGKVSVEHAPTFLAADRTGRYLLSAYYQGGCVMVHPLAGDGAVGAPSLDRIATATGAHAIQTDPSNRFAFVPHIARLIDNVLEPPKPA